MVETIDLNSFAGGAAGGSIIALIMGFLLIFLLIAVGFWIYMALAFTAIGRKARLSSPGIAWIPLIGPVIIAFQTSKMHWWPWLLLIGVFVPGFIGPMASLAFAVFTVIWQWKMFERIRRPGWWSLLCLIPVVNLILIGIAAWSK